MTWGSSRKRRRRIDQLRLEPRARIRMRMPNCFVGIGENSMSRPLSGLLPTTPSRKSRQNLRFFRRSKNFELIEKIGKRGWRQISPKNQIFIRIKLREPSNPILCQIVFCVKFINPSNYRARQIPNRVKP